MFAIQSTVMTAVNLFTKQKFPSGISLVLSYLHDDIFLKNSKEFI